MPIDPLLQWQDAFIAIKPDDKSGAKKLADAIDQRVTGKLQLSLVQGPPAQFTWKKDLFAQLIETLPASPELPSGIQALCDAWEAATMASTLVVTAGAFIGAPAPPTLFSVVLSSMILPPSITAAKVQLFTILSTSAPVPDPKAATAHIAYYTAFSLLQGDVKGLDSTPTPAGPLPLMIVSPVI